MSSWKQPGAEPYTRTGEALFSQMEKINAELLTMTYGSIVMQLIKDYSDVNVVNTELEKMGYNIGVRLVEEFLAKSNTQSCNNFRETGLVIAKVAFKMFLGVNCEATNWREDGKGFSLVFKDNPLHNFVQVPPEYSELKYSNILCGVIRGALFMVRLSVDCEYVKSELAGANESEIAVTLREVLQEVYNDPDE